MDEFIKVIAPALPPWVVWPAAGIAALVFLWSKAQSIWIELVPWRRTLSREKLRLEVVKLRYEIDARAHIGRWTTADVAVVGDARRVAEQLLAALPGRRSSEKPFHTAESLATIAGFDIARDFEAAHTPRTVDPRALGVELDGLLPRERNVVYDAGNFLGILPYLTVPTPDHLKMTSEFASIGLGFGTALGVAKGRPRVPTVLGIGDGGFLTRSAAWTTCARSDRCWASRTAPSFWTARSTRTSPRPSWASSPNSKRDSTVDQEGRPLRVSDSVIVAAAIS